jgi:hypothetical protein
LRSFNNGNRGGGLLPEGLRGRKAWSYVKEKMNIKEIVKMKDIKGEYTELVVNDDISDPEQDTPEFPVIEKYSKEPTE